LCRFWLEGTFITIKETAVAACAVVHVISSEKPCCPPMSSTVLVFLHFVKTYG
jgi:hypothetical protein